MWYWIGLCLTAKFHGNFQETGTWLARDLHSRCSHMRMHACEETVNTVIGFVWIYGWLLTMFSRKIIVFIQVKSTHNKENLERTLNEPRKATTLPYWGSTANRVNENLFPNTQYDRHSHVQYLVPYSQNCTLSIDNLECWFRHPLVATNDRPYTFFIFWWDHVNQKISASRTSQTTTSVP
jgi:hypothetical protein